MVFAFGAVALSETCDFSSRDLGVKRQQAGTHWYNGILIGDQSPFLEHFYVESCTIMMLDHSGTLSGGSGATRQAKGKQNVSYASNP